MPQRLQKTKKDLVEKREESLQGVKKFHFSKTFGVALFIVGILMGGSLWSAYKIIAATGAPGTTADQLRPTQPPPFGNPAPPLQAKAAAADVQATNGFLKVGFNPSDTAAPTAVPNRTEPVNLQVSGIAKAKDFCTDESSPKCLSASGTGTSSGGSGWEVVFRDSFTTSTSSATTAFSGISTIFDPQYEYRLVLKSTSPASGDTFVYDFPCFWNYDGVANGSHAGALRCDVVGGRFSNQTNQSSWIQVNISGGQYNIRGSVNPGETNLQPPFTGLFNDSMTTTNAGLIRRSRPLP